MKQLKKKNLIHKSLLGMIPFTIITAVVLLIVTKNLDHEAESFLVGSIVSGVTNLWNYRIITNVAAEDYKKIGKYTVISYFIRYFIYIGLAAIAYFVSFLNPIYLVIGFFSFKIMLILCVFVFKQEGE